MYNTKDKIKRRVNQTKGRIEHRQPVERVKNTRDVAPILPYHKKCIAICVFFAHMIPFDATYALSTSRVDVYDYDRRGLIQKTDGPRTDVDDVTRYEYDEKRRMILVTNALSQTQHYTYDSHSRVKSITDTNGIETRLRYHPRGWLLSSTIVHPSGDAAKNLVTTFQYDGVGQLTHLTSHDGQTTQYRYDKARRLTAVINHLGERQDFVLDAAGNITKETIKNISEATVYQVTRQFDELSRLMNLVGAAKQTTHYDYDANDNPVAMTNGRKKESRTEFDALNRVKKSLDPLLAETQYTYDSDDQITSVTDARGLKTHYQYNAFGDLIEQTSPDTGTTTFAYDNAGNQIQKTDARGVETRYTYDALNRLTHIAYPDSSENMAFEYDDVTQGNYGNGRMTKVDDASGETTYRYNYLGQVTDKVYSIEGSTFDTDYSYDDNARLSQFRYPSGREIQYHYDTLGRIARITTKANASAATETVVNNIRYLPFGPLQSWQFGNGVQHTLRYDQDYRLAAQKTEGTTTLIHADFSYDGNNNITAIDTPNRTAASQRFAYNDVDRIDTAKGLYGEIDYKYDVVGNRTLRKHTRGSGSTLETYHYSPINQRLQRVTSDSDEERNFGYDTNGNVISDLNGLVKSWIYNNQNRPASIKVGANTTRYLHNYRGQRSYKENGSNKHRFHYDDAGQLIAVSDQNGVFIEEHIWLYNNQVATLRTDMEAN